MYFLLLLLLICALLITFAFTNPLSIYFLLDSERMDMHLTAVWLSLFKITAKPENSKMKISVYILNQKVMTKIPRKKKKANLTLLRALSLQDNQIEIFYGLNEPQIAGLVCGVLSSLREVLRIPGLRQYPNFLPENEYLRISANVRLNLGKTLVNLMSMKTKGEKA